MIDALLVDDHPIVRAGWRYALEAEDDIRVTAEAGGREEALACFQKGRFDVVALDLFLRKPGGGEDFALPLMKDLLLLRPSQGVLILTVVPDRMFLLTAFKEGARGYLSKDAELTLLVRAVRAVASGHAFLHDAQNDLVATLLIGEARPLPHERLSLAELEVFLLLGAGQTPARLASQRGKSVSTINNQRQACLEKTGLTNNAEIMLYCLMHGLLGL